MIIAGVDLGGRKIAISMYQNQTFWCVKTISVPKTDRATELWELAAWAEMILKPADLVVIEEPLIGRGVRSSLQLAQTAGAVLSRLGETATHTRTAFVEVSTWKKEIVGRGNVTKEEVRNWLEREHPAYATQCGADQDRIDATCIGLYAVRLHQRSQELEEL